MSYTYSKYNSIDFVPAADWLAVGGGRLDFFMDPRFLSAMECGLSDEARFWHLVVRDAAGQPMAITCLSRYGLDAGDLGHRWVYREVQRMRKIFPNYLRIPVLFCGLPFSGGQSHLRIAPMADRREVIRVLHTAMSEIGIEAGAWFLVFKECGPEDLETLDDLLEFGYRRAESLPMNSFEPRFADFDEFCGALRSHYRYKLRKSQKKFDRAGLRVEHFQGDAIIERYTDRVHQFYNDVVDRAEVKLERLPRKFFHEMVRRCPAESRFAAVLKGDQILAFSWGLLADGVYRNLFVGLDYETEIDADVYFNLMMHDLQHALSQPVKDIQLGQTADIFKSRLGCYHHPRYLYARGAKRFSNWLLSAVSRWAFPPPAPAPPRDLYRDPAPEPTPPPGELLLDIAD